ncbi:hypothetical protein [Catellatospora vulcania]|uniref:hypothetical protein n=1 Tax=Catellatospora vulcania TaxID=1460450 RepID=UPI001E342826|nr:hypothetical protein [Catellatospora vulcania]
MTERDYWDPLPTARAAVGTPYDDGPYRKVLVAPLDTTFRGVWSERNWRNVPGPFYGAQTDTCLTGRLHAADLVLYDEGGQEFVYRQPTDQAAVYRLLMAAEEETFLGYGADGDDHWTPDAVRAWWRDRGRVLESIRQGRDEWRDGTHRLERDQFAGLAEYRRYIEHGLEDHLRRYSFWLDHRRDRRPGETLPDL